MRRLCIALALAALPAAIFASTATNTLTVVANVLAGGTCTVDAAYVGFPSLTPPLTANVDQQNGMMLSCPNGTPYAISLSAGGSGNQTARQMLLSGGTSSDLLSYNIYTTAAYTTIWGDGTAGTATVTGTGTGSTVYPTLFGRIPPQATPPAGSYGDVLTITVTY